jgi:hypothetical protein
MNELHRLVLTILIVMAIGIVFWAIEAFRDWMRT